MQKFKIPSVPPTTNKCIRFPNDIIEEVEKAIKGKQCTFTAFVVEAVRVRWIIWKKKTAKTQAGNKAVNQQKQLFCGGVYSAIHITTVYSDRESLQYCAWFIWLMPGFSGGVVRALTVKVNIEAYINWSRYIASAQTESERNALLLFVLFMQRLFLSLWCTFYYYTNDNAVWVWWCIWCII